MKIALRLIFALLAIPLLFAKLPQASAHTLQIDNDISGVLHTDPDHNPVAGQPAKFFFLFGDRSRRFKPELCDCTAEIFSGNQMVASLPIQPVQGQTDANMSFNYTLQQPGLYTVEVIGKPKTDNAFQSFDLKYDDVEAGLTASHTNHLWHGLAFFGFFPVAWLLNYLAEKKSARKRAKIEQSANLQKQNADVQ